mgnify:FL=1
MSQFIKVFWVIRALFYKIFFLKMGFPSYLGKPIFISGHSRISFGSNVREFPNARIEVHGNRSILDIKDDVSIGQGVHLISGGKLVIGKGVTIASYVFINNMDNDYKEIGIPILKQRTIINNTIIGENCFVGIGTSIHPGTILGRQCIVGSNSVVKGEYPDYCVIVGNPAKIIKKYNKKTKTWDRV